MRNKRFRLIKQMPLVFIVAIVVGCSKSMHEGRYHLELISGSPDLTADFFDYNYIDLKANAIYYQKSKIKGYDAIIEHNGKWKVYGESLTLTNDRSTESDSNTFTIQDDTLILVTDLDAVIKWKKEKSK